MLLKFCDWFVYQLLGLPKDQVWSGAVHFFIYDAIKILVLLYVMIFLIGVLRTFIPQQRIKKWMAQKGLSSHFYAALFGAITPFCSCSSIPMFLSFLKAGIPLGVALSFLITSPLINEYLVVIMIGLFGWKISLLYVISGMGLGVISGAVIARMNLEKYLVADLFDDSESAQAALTVTTLKDRLGYGLHEANDIVRKIWYWVLVGVALGAFIHNYIPQDKIQAAISGTGLLSVPIATLLGVPMYGSCAAILPVAVVLFQKGIPLGTALAFMMAVSALSLPEAIMLRRAMRLNLIAAFFGIVTLGIIVIGYLFNFFQVFIIV